MHHKFLLALAATSLAVSATATPAIARAKHKQSSTSKSVKQSKPAEPARPAEPPKPAEEATATKPLTDHDPTIIDAAKTPLTDLNLGRDNEIPAILRSAIADPYTLKGLDKCNRLVAAVAELDEALGPDIDLPQNERARLSEGRIARWAISSFIPFRGLIREISGANRQDELVGDAIQAGQTRRGFLKGVGMARKCKYPARPATPEMIRAALVGPPPHTQASAKDAKPPQDSKSGKPAENEAQNAKPAKQPKSSSRRGSKKVKFTSQPVVQPVP